MADKLADRPRAVVLTPAARGVRTGNRTTALRLCAILRQLGWTARVRTAWRDEPCELVVAVHAVKAAAAAVAAKAARPAARLVVVLAGTDVYPRYEPTPDSAATLAAADAIVALQPLALQALPVALRGKGRTIVQSAAAPAMPHGGAVNRAAGNTAAAHDPAPANAAPPRPFRACVLAHLRPVKDPWLPVPALAHVPPSPPVEVLVAGRALSDALAAAMTAACAAEPRARWLGELPRRRALALLAGSDACVVPSAAEGGANVVSEALAAGVPLLASDVPGNTALLGADWPGLFAVGDAAGLGRLLARAAADAQFRAALRARAAALRPLVDPARERAAWAALLRELPR
jgi:glycosyltransferase involved in cell wall biosynthesis